MYNKDRMERVLQEFQTVMSDIQAAIATRVANSISELIRQDIQHVLQDSMSDFSDEATYAVRCTPAAFHTSSEILQYDFIS